MKVKFEVITMERILDQIDIKTFYMFSLNYNVDDKHGTCYLQVLHKDKDGNINYRTILDGIPDDNFNYLEQYFKLMQNQIEMLKCTLHTLIDVKYKDYFFNGTD